MARRSVIGSLLCLVALLAAGSAVAAAPPTGSAALDLIGIKFDRHHGTATVLAHVSGPGTLSVAGGQVVPRSVEASGAGIAKLKVASKGGALKTLIRSGAVEVRIRVEFAAAEGAHASVVRKMTLLRPRAL